MQQKEEEAKMLPKLGQICALDYRLHDKLYEYSLATSLLAEYGTPQKRRQPRSGLHASNVCCVYQKNRSGRR